MQLRSELLLFQRHNIASHRYSRIPGRRGPSPLAFRWKLFNLPCGHNQSGRIYGTVELHQLPWRNVFRRLRLRLHHLVSGLKTREDTQKLMALFNSPDHSTSGPGASMCSCSAGYYLGPNGCVACQAGYSSSAGSTMASQWYVLHVRRQKRSGTDQCDIAVWRAPSASTVSLAKSANPVRWVLQPIQAAAQLVLAFQATSQTYVVIAAILR